MLRSNRYIIGLSLIIILFIASISITFNGLNLTVGMLKQLASKDIEILILTKDIQFQDLTLTNSVRGLIINPSSEKDLQVYNEYHDEINNSIMKIKQIAPDSIQTFNKIDNLNKRLFELEFQMMNASSSEEAVSIYKEEYTQLRNQLQNILTDFADEKKNNIVEHANYDAQKSADLQQYSIITGLLTALVSIFISILLISERREWEHQTKEYQKNLRTMGTELSRVQENERSLIATEIHDYLGQSLAVVKIKLGLLGESLTIAEDKDNLDQIKSFVNQAIKYIQGLTFKLNLPTHSDIEFTDALEWICRQFTKDYGIRVKVENERSLKSVNKNARIILLRAVRELLNNVIKHSSANQVYVKVNKLDKNVKITVKDNGSGFEPSKLKNNKFDENGGFGLFSIRESLQYLGGNMNIESKKGSGTIVIMEVPLESLNNGVVL